MTSPATRRAEVLALRIALERAAVFAFAHTCQPSGETPQSRIRLRLLFLVTFVPSDDVARVRRLARLGGHVYKLTSDVLHGRLRAVALDGRVLGEWRAVVDDIEALVSRSAVSSVEVPLAHDRA